MDVVRCFWLSEKGHYMGFLRRKHENVNIGHLLKKVTYIVC